jgi:hypothetical protein
MIRTHITKWTSTITFARNYFHYHFQNNVTNPNSNEYKLTAIVLDIAGHRLFKPVGIKKDEIDKRSFLKLLFATSRREVLLIFLRSPITTWPVGLYMNGEIAQVQPGVLDLKSSILRSCNTCFYHYIRSKLFSLPLSKQCYKSEFKRIQTYSNRLGYCRSQTC